MKNNLQIYVDEQFGKIRGLLINGVPYFVGKDVAKALGYKNFRDALSKHVDEEDKKDGVAIRDSIGRKQEPVLINESGLYSLILTSKLPQSKDFKRWVTSVVLPQIRQTGMYVSDRAYQKYLESRQHSTDVRIIETGVIKQYIAYARAQGDTRDERLIYASITIWSNLAAGLPKRNGRDFASSQQLNIVALIEERVIPNVLINGMAQGLHYTRIEAQVQVRINEFLTVIFQTPLTPSDFLLKAK